MTQKCECPNFGVFRGLVSLYNPITELPFIEHNPGECRCTNNIKLYNRNGKTLYLCSICHLPDDKEPLT